MEEKRKLLTATNIELADLVEAKKEAEKALAESCKQQEVRSYVPHRPCSRLVRPQTPQKVSENCPPAFTPMNPTKRDVNHALGVLEQIKHEMSHLFPEVERLLKEKAPSYSSMQRVSSRKSQVEKLPSVPLTNPVNLVAAPVASAEEVKPTRSLSQRPSRISQSTLAAISQMWANAMEEAANETATMEESQPEQFTIEIASQAIEESHLPQSTKDSVSQTMEDSQLKQSMMNPASQTTMKVQHPTVDAASQTTMKEPTMDVASQTTVEESQNVVYQTMDEGQLQLSTLEATLQANMDAASSQSSIWCEAPSIDDFTVSFEDRLDKVRSSGPTPVSQAESCSTICRRPSSLECQSSDGLRIDEGRAPNEMPQEESYHSICRPPSIECMSSEALRIDEGRITKQQSPLQEEKLSCTLNEGAHQYDSASTLGMLSTRWSTLQEVDNDCSQITESTTDLNDPDPCKECQEDDTSPEQSFYRAPTPPAYPKPLGSHVRGVISCQSSLRQIKEDCPSDFSTEFTSPLAVHTAVVPYHSQRTRLGLKKNIDLTSNEQKQYYEERLKDSRADLAGKEEEIRKSLLDLVPPKRTVEEFYTAEAEGNPVPAPTPVVSTNVSETQMKEKVSFVVVF